MHFGGAGQRTGNYETPEGEVENSQSRTAMGQVGAAWTGDKSYVGASYGYDDTKYGMPVVEEGQISLTPQAAFLQCPRRRPEPERLAAVVPRHARRPPLRTLRARRR